MTLTRNASDPELEPLGDVADERPAAESELLGEQRRPDGRPPTSAVAPARPAGSRRAVRPSATRFMTSAPPDAERRGDRRHADREDQAAAPGGGPGSGCRQRSAADRAGRTGRSRRTARRGSPARRTANCAAGEVRDERRRAGPSAGPPSSRPYSQQREHDARGPPTTAVQIRALAKAAPAVLGSRPDTTASAWSIPRPTIVAASCEIQQDQREAALGVWPEGPGQEDVGREDQDGETEPRRDRDESRPGGGATTWRAAHASRRGGRPIGAQACSTSIRVSIAASLLRAGRGVGHDRGQLRIGQRGLEPARRPGEPLLEADRRPVAEPARRPCRPGSRCAGRRPREPDRDGSRAAGRRPARSPRPARSRWSRVRCPAWKISPGDRPPQARRAPPRSRPRGRRRTRSRGSARRRRGS